VAKAPGRSHSMQFEFAYRLASSLVGLQEPVDGVIEWPPYRRRVGG
jgi:hypothetical protein